MGSKKNKKNHASSEKTNGTTKVITDERFASVHSDPRFQKVPKHKAKVAIDSRFQRMFSDKSFSSASAPLDKRGRPKKQTGESSLRHYYRMDEDDEKKERRKPEEEEEDEESEGTGDSESEEVDAEVRGKLPRVGGDESSESELEDGDSELGSETGSEMDGESNTDTDTDEGEDLDDDVQHEFQLQEDNVPVIEKETHRLAVVNLDWRHVSAADLYVMLSSFLPKDGQLKSVAVYPSEFGLQRMKEEEVHGPVGLFNDENKKRNEDDDDEIDNETLRAYERSRLRYYYAVVECDSIATADYLYNSCDGVEFERSSNVLDLRFIPDSMEFKHPPRDVCTEAPTSYEGLNFETRALQHSDIQLTWDDDEPHRVKTLKRKFNADQLADMELKEFLASDESDSDDNEDATEDISDKKIKKVEKYRALIQLGDGSDEDNEEGQDMEVTFNTGLEDLSKRMLEKKDKKSETVWEAHLRKRREKKKARLNKSKHSSDDESSDTDQEPIDEPDDFFVEEPAAKKSKKEMQGKSSKAGKKHQQTIGEEASTAELELLVADDNGADTEIKGYNIKRKKGKGKKGKEELDEDKIPTADINEPRFSNKLALPEFALDPTDPNFKRSAVYARQVVMKREKRRHDELKEKEDILPSARPELPPNVPEQNKENSSLPSSRDKYELSSLVRSVKSKSKQLQLTSESKKALKDKKKRSGGKS